MAELKENMLVEVVNNGTGSVSYFSETSRMKRRWDKPGSKKKIPLEELRELVSMAGGFELLENYLFIADVDVREELGLPVEKEVMLTDKEITALFKKADSTLKTTLENTTDAIVEKIAHLAIESGLNDLNKLELIQEYSGIDVLASIKEKKEEEKTKEDSKKKNTGKRGRPRRSQN